MLCASLGRHCAIVKQGRSSRTPGPSFPTLPRVSTASPHCTRSYASLRSVQRTSLAQSSMRAHSQVNKFHWAGRLQSRFYSTPAPVDEPAKVVADTFVQSAVQSKEAVVHSSNAVSVNEGWSILMDPAQWDGWVLDPIFYSVQGLMEAVHLTTGLPWWLSLIAYAGLIRVVAFPLLIRQTKGTLESIKMRPELEAMQKKWMYMAQQKADGKTDLEALKEITRDRQRILKNSLSSMPAAFGQAAVMIANFIIIRAIAGDETLQLPLQWAQGGAFWFENLCQYDPYYALPFITALAGASLVAVMPSPMAGKTRLMIAGAAAAATVAFTLWMPAAIHLVWITTSLTTSASYLLLNIPILRRICGLPSHEEVNQIHAIIKPIELFNNKPSTRAASRVAVPPAANNTSAANVEQATEANNNAARKHKSKQKRG